MIESVEQWSPEGEHGIVAPAVRVQLLGGFDLVIASRSVVVPRTSQRLVALLALLDRRVERLYIASSLWPDVRDARALANLRSAIWRLHDGPPIIRGSPSHLWLDATVEVDHHLAVSRALRLIDADAELADEDFAAGALDGELLPGWESEWVLLERERLRQLRLHALDALSHRLTARGLPARAVVVGLAAVAAEPLRESAQRSLISAHLALGNRSEAIRQYRRFRNLLADELGLEPSALMTDVLAALGPDLAT